MDEESLGQEEKSARTPQTESLPVQYPQYQTPGQPTVAGQFSAPTQPLPQSNTWNASLSTQPVAPSAQPTDLSAQPAASLRSMYAETDDSGSYAGEYDASAASPATYVASNVAGESIARNSVASESSFTESSFSNDHTGAASIGVASTAEIPFGDDPRGAEPEKAKKKKAKKGPGWGAVIAMSAVAALVGGGIGLSSSQLLQPSTSTFINSGTSGVHVAPVVESKGEAPNWQAVHQAVGNAVVAIDTQLERGTSAGSGVIIDAQGHVLTNNHVIAGATQIYVTLADGRLFKASVAGADAATDLAVITIENPPQDLTVATVGDSAALHVGQSVAAIGNPLGLSSTMTTGIISALNRPVSTQESNEEQNQRFPFARPQQSSQVVTNAIQIDAAVNPGNSGGPVFDSAGRVIGIASSIATLSGGGESGSIGLGFAIPINLAKMIAQQLIDNGVAEHAFLGVTISDGAAQYNGENRLGAEVQSVSAGTPAARAGIKKGDVIISIGGSEVSSATSLTGFVRQYRSGDKVKITLERDGQLLDATVTLATKQDDVS